jgi:GT2 family glycosyltransferase
MSSTDSTIGFYLPFWGDLEYLIGAVNSIRHQTDGRWTLTVINDDYPDPRVDDYFADIDDPRIRYIRNPVNVGITANFRKCVQLAIEPVVVIVGYDDVVLPGYVGAVIEAYEAHPDVAIIQPGVEVIDGDGIPSEPLVDIVKQRLLRPARMSSVKLQGDRLAAGLMHGNWLYWPSLAFRREVLVGHDFRDEFSVIQDLALILDVLLAGEYLLTLPDVVFRYRRHEASASSMELVDGSRFRGEREFFRLAAALAQDHAWRRTVFAARLHLTSRLHALLLAPRALKGRDARGVGLLLRHAFGS